MKLSQSEMSLHRPNVKICCISSITEANSALAAGANTLGLVAKMPSGPGTIDDPLIKTIINAIPASTNTFLLTAEIEAIEIAKHVNFCGASTVQIVNHIDPKEYQQLRQLLPTTELVQVIHVEDQHAISLAKHYAPLVDKLLLDSGRPSAKIQELGGTGRAHDWDISAQIVKRVEVPVFLAGGINPLNVADAIQAVQPYGIDLCSGVRTTGLLDTAKLAALFRQIDLLFA